MESTESTLVIPMRPVMRTRRVMPEDIIRFYDDKGTKKKPLPRTLDPDNFTLTNTPMGIGDCVMMTDFPRAAAEAGKTGTAWLCCAPFRDLANLNPYHKDKQLPFWVSLSALNAAFDLGPGHNFQRARRMFGLPVDSMPRGCVVVPGVRKPKRMKVSIHLVAGNHALHQQQLYHPRARQVYPENLAVIRNFIRNHPEVDFVEVGGAVLKGVVPNINGLSFAESIHHMAECSLHIGIISGPYHVANALGLRTICIINFPAPWELMLPTAKNIDMVESEWLYPQSHILHQDHDSLHWPKFSLSNLEAAFNQETYPYDDPNEFLSLVSK